MTINFRQTDTDSREKIVHEIEQNFFVEAGAGSGKTTVLVERMVAMVEAGIDISKISAITFTKAAANEFYARFQKRLSERANEPTRTDFVYQSNRLDNPNDRTREYCRKALENIDLAFMGTIDSFCNMIMSEHPSEGLIPSDSYVIDGTEAEQYYKKEYSNIMNEMYDDEKLNEKARLFIRYNSRPEEVFIYVLKDILANRDCTLAIPKYSTGSIETEFANQINTVRKIVKILCDNPQYITSSNDDKAEAVRDSFSRNKDNFLNSWDDNTAAVIDAFKYTFKNGDFRISTDPAAMNTLAEGGIYFREHLTHKKVAWYELDKDRFELELGELFRNRYAISLDFVNSAKEAILKKLRKEGKLTFSDYLIYLRDTLKKDAENKGRLIAHIQERHERYLIDEFQDTDPIQSEVFFYLASQKLSSKWNECIPKPGSLFIVGDPKQSIYRFKNADVASFLNVKKLFTRPEVGEVLNLYCNFRSTYEVKNWFNNTFKSLLVDGPEQSEYPEIPTDETEKIPGNFSGIYYYEVDATVKKDFPESFDTFKVKEIILRLRGNEDFRIAEKVKENGTEKIVYRTLDWKDFMIITPGKSALSDFSKEFRTSNIPCYVEGNINFLESKALKTLFLLFAAATIKNNNSYLYGTLKSGLFQIPEKDITAAVESDYFLRTDASYEGTNLSTELKNALDTIRGYARDSRKMQPSVLFAKMIEDENLFRLEGDRNLEYVYFALELMKEAENCGKIVTSEDAVDFLNRLLYTKNSQERCPGLEKDLNKVHMANLHKVKGLEAPVVILAHPKYQAKKPKFRMERKPSGNTGYLFATTKKSKDGADITIIDTEDYTEFKDMEAISIEAESKRLQYVAATRARNVLIMAYMKKADNSQSASSRWFDLLNLNKPDNDIMDVLNGVKPDIQKRKEVPYSDIQTIPNPMTENMDTQKKETLVIRRPSTEKENRQIYDAEITERQRMSIDEHGEDTYSTVIGTMVHRLMEQIILSKNRIIKDAIPAIVDECMAVGFENCRSEFIDTLNNVYATINNGGFNQVNGAEKDILKVIMEADETYPEVPFTYLKDGAVWNGIIDFIYKKDGRLHIIDWKTNKSDKDLNEHYSRQLAAYKLSVEEMTGEKVEDALIYHIDINRK